MVYGTVRASPVVAGNCVVSRRRRRGWAELAAARLERVHFAVWVAGVVQRNRNFVEVPLVRARQKMSLVAVSRFFEIPIQMNFPARPNSHSTPPQRAAG